MPKNSTNNKLIEDLQKGNELVFADIYNQYHQALHCNICKLVTNKHEAEDILQEVFIALWNNRHKLTPSHSVPGWLFTASYYKALENIRKTIKESFIVFTDELNEAFITDAGSNTFETDYIQKLSMLNDAIELLPPQKKLAFKLCRIEGKTYEEIAVALNISVESARDYVKSASKLVKNNILSQKAISSAMGAYLMAIFLQN